MKGEGAEAKDGQVIPGGKGEVLLGVLILRGGGLLLLSRAPKKARNANEKREKNKTKEQLPTELTSKGAVFVVRIRRRSFLSGGLSGDGHL
jgi:hypothetical protein